MEPRISCFSSAVGCADRSVDAVPVFLGAFLSRPTSENSHVLFEKNTVGLEILSGENF